MKGLLAGQPVVMVMEPGLGERMGRDGKSEAELRSEQ